MTNIDANLLQQAFARNCDTAAVRVKPESPEEWWLTGVSNLAEVGPVIAAHYRVSVVACIRALRDQFPGGNLEALRDFAHWCHTHWCPEKHPA